MHRNYSSFIKFGEQKHMENLLTHGEIFCRPIDYFCSVDDADLRGDKNDGAAYLKQIRDLNFKHEGNIIATAKTGQLFGRNSNDKGNIYCLFGLANESLDWKSKTTEKLILNLESLGFGDTAILIYDPGEFIKRVKKVVTENGFKINFSPIVYFDYSTYEGELSPFTKSDKYQSQSEVRFWIPNKSGLDLTFNIGNISDIAGLLSREMLDKLEYEIE